MTVNFTDLEDFDAPQPSKNTGVTVPRDITEVQGAIHREACPKCGGTGVYRGYSSLGRQCLKCNGTGKLEFKTTKEQRERNRARVQSRKLTKQATNLEAFEKAHPEIAQWWNRSDFPFAQAMRQAVTKYGDLTERQMASALKCVEADKAHAARQAERQQAAEQAKALAPAVEVSAVVAALARGAAKGIRKPILRLAGDDGAAFVFSRAWAGGKNAGGVYVNGPQKEYYGVIKDGKFIRSRDCDDATEQAVVAVCANPETSAIAYGRRFGVCSCCGRELTNKVSIDLGIGPVCRGKFFI